MKITEGQHAVIKDLLEQYRYPAYDPTIHLTILDALEAWNVTYSTARRRLEISRKAGDMEKILVDNKGDILIAYKPVETK